MISKSRRIRSTSAISSLIVALLASVGMLTSPASAVSAPVDAASSLKFGDATSKRAVVVIEGGGSSHPFTTPWDACDGGRIPYVQALVDAKLPVFTAPGYTNHAESTWGLTGCPLQPPVELQWNTSAYPTQAAQSVLGFLGYLRATYGYQTFDLVGYSYGGVISRATIAELKKTPKSGKYLPAFSYAQQAVDAGVKIPTLITLNTPHLGGPAYDIANNPAKYLVPVTQGWGRQIANAGTGLRYFLDTDGAGDIQFLTTAPHAKQNPKSWDAKQVGVLDDVALTLIAGDYCAETCGTSSSPAKTMNVPRTDGTVPVYSQLMLPCPSACPVVPGSVFIPKGLVPDSVVRKTFPVVHSLWDTWRNGLPNILSVANNPASIKYLVTTVTSQWQKAGVPLLAS